MLVRLVCNVALTTTLFGFTVNAQSLTETDDAKAYSRTPKEIAFQNDSQWEDNRWQKSDIGPFYCGTIATGKGTTLKGIAIRVGDAGQAALCFDTARMRVSAAWTGEFLEFSARRFGLTQPPKAAGKTFYTTAKMAGWAKDGRFHPNPYEITDTSIAGYKEGTSETRLPKDWAYFKGLYPSGNRVVLSYSVGSADVLESPWYVHTDDDHAFTRTFEVGPSDRAMKLLVGDKAVQVSLLSDDEHLSVDPTTGVIEIGAHDAPIRFKVLLCRSDASAQAVESLRRIAGAPENLSLMVTQDRGRFRETVTTAGTTTEEGGPYVIDTLTLPFENPWKALMFTSGHDFFSDGTAAVCTIQGDVWTVAGIDRELKELRWRRYASGLCQPLGLKIVDDKIYVVGRNQITRLHDRNGDGEADFHENFNNDMIISPRGHDFVTCLDTDPAGNFYFIHAKTGVMRVSSDGSELTSVADGFRNPNGMAVGPDGTITAAPQQGTWTPESSLIVVKEGDYYGFGGPRITEERPTGWDLPMCFIPRAMDNSGGAQVWVEGDRWGPLTGKMLHLSYGQCRMLLALTENIGGKAQGGTIKFPTEPNDFESGVMRGRFNPHDGQLYVTGLRGWQSRAIRDGCLQRVRYTGGPLRLPIDVKTFNNGIKLTFSEPLDPEFAENVDNYFVQQWNYLWSAEYGSPEFSVAKPQEQGRDEVDVDSATLMDDGRSVFLEMPNRHPVNQLSISWLLRGLPSHADDGKRFRGTFVHTINTQPTESIPESLIIRKIRPRRISEDVEQRLKPGLQFRVKSATTGETDVRTSRLLAMRQQIHAPPTPFLPAGPFGLEATGTLRTTHSGFYDFKVKSSGVAQLWINDIQVIDSAEYSTTLQPILIHKGHNPIRVRFKSPTEGVAELQLFWKGYDFGWEPVSADHFFHDADSKELIDSQKNRDGRELFADHRCIACHQGVVDGPAMFELGLDAPNLANVSDRFSSEWLRQWMVSPKRLNPQASMPAVLGDGDAANQDAADIEAYLRRVTSTTNTIPPSISGAADDIGAPENGDELYERLGCIACHHFESPGKTDVYGRRSLQHANAKFSRGSLVNFLRNPTEFHASTRMPDFRISDEEARALAAFLRTESGVRPSDLEGETDNVAGDADRGEKLFGTKGCAQCHDIGKTRPAESRQITIGRSDGFAGCLQLGSDRNPLTPDFAFSDFEKQALESFLREGTKSLRHTSDAETSARLVSKLLCANCHDRDGIRSHRTLVIAEEGSGSLAEQLPQLTRSGEKLQPIWTRNLLAGKLRYESRPWLKARMPAFPAYASALAKGFAAEHGIDPHSQPDHSVDKELASVGEELSLQTGLDCRQCHAIGNQQPRGDKDTKIALGINFTFIRDRLRHDAYHRFMLDPPRYDINTRMIRLSENGLTTKLKRVFDADAHKQFDAIWHYMQSLPDASTLNESTR